MKPYYAAISPDGQLLGLDPDTNTAIERVQDTVGKRAPITVQLLPDKEAFLQNPTSSDQMPIIAERNCQIGRISRDDVMNMESEEARELLNPFFDGLIYNGRPTKTYNKPASMAGAWIGQNYKTKKPSQDPKRPAEVMGLTLVPAWQARSAAREESPYDRLFIRGDKDDDEDAATLQVAKRKMLARWRDPEIGLPSRITPKFNWCAGSSPECRDSCLIFAGQNAAARYNTYRKVAQSMSLLHQPVAFMRMLIDSIDQWIDGCNFYLRKNRGAELNPFFRMNVLSDIPWERIAPWFFTHFTGRAGENGKKLRFYDYTKVPGRRGMPGMDLPFPKNYDLTFSLSGENANEQYAIEEIECHDSRIAVVFLGHRKSDGEWQTYLGKGDIAQKELPLPERFQIGNCNLRVLDGDKSDVRPHNPGRTCIGLRWKTPSEKRSGVETDYEKMAFVTPVYVMSQGKPSVYSGKGRYGQGYETNPEDRDAVLISAVTPRHEPIDQPMSQAF
jgi:hypothetical protein